MTAAATPVDDRQRNQILLVLFIGVLMAALDIAIVGPALPAIKQAFNADDRGLTWVFTIYVLLNLVGTPLIARLSDLFGRRTIYTMSVSLFAIGSLLVATAPSFTILLIGRAIQGFGAGGIFPVASAVIGDTFPPEKRGGALGLIGAVFGIAFLLGPILGGALLLLSWHWLFFINLPIAAIVIVLGLRTLPGRGETASQPFDWLGTLLLTVMLTAMAYGLTALGQGIRTGTADPLTWPLLVGAIILLPIFGVVSRRTSSPVVDLRLFRNRQIVLVGALALGSGICEAVILFVPSLLVEAFRVTPASASFMLIPMVLGMAVGSPFSGRMLDKSGSRLVVLIGTILLTASLIIIGLFATNLILYYVFAVLFGVGIGVLLGASLRYIMLNEVQGNERASSQGLLTIFISIGQLFGAALMGALVAARGGTDGYAVAFLASGAVMLLLTFAATQLKSRAAELETVQRNQAAA
jgi:EmrB/QacA subfamily drug resistance transporter